MISDVQRAAQLQGLFFHTMSRLPPALATAYAHEYLIRVPLLSAVHACQIGGLLNDHWMPIRFAARDAVIAQHGGAEHFAQTPAGQHTLVKNAPTDGEEIVAV